VTWEAIKDRPLAWCLVLSGLTDRYYSRVAPGNDLDSGVPLSTSTTYRDVEALVSVGPIRGSIDETGAVAKQAPVEVVLRARDASYAGRAPGDAMVDPVSTLRRITPRGSPLRTRLAASLPHALAVTDIEVDDDVSAWDLPCLIYIGQEAFWADSAAGDGTDGDPWRFVDCTRAVARTQVQAHVRDAARGLHPFVTSQPVTWRGRRAAIYVSAVGPDGLALGWRQYWRGLLDHDPEVSADALTISVRIAPLTSVLGWRLQAGGASEMRTTFVRGWHYLGPDAACEVDISLHAPVGAIIKSQVQAAGGGNLEVYDLDGYASVVAATDVTLPDGHPRRTQLRNQANVEDYPTGFTAPDTVEVDPAGPLAAAAYLISTPQTESTPLRLIDQSPGGTHELVRWWERVQDVVNFGVAWQSDYHPESDTWGASLIDTDTGRWARVLIAPMAQGWLLRGLLNWEAQNPPLEVHPIPLERRLGCWLGVCLAPPDALQAIRGGSIDAAVHPPSPLLTIRRSSSADGQWDQTPIIGIPDVWYQPGEHYLGPVVDDIYTGTGGATQWVRITGQDTDVEIAIKGSTLVQDSEGADVGYVLEVDRAVDGGRGRGGPILQMAGDSPFVVTPSLRADGVTAAEFLLSLLLSGTGGGTNDADYDVLPYGCNLARAEVNVESFEALALPEALAAQTWRGDPTKTISDQMRSILMLAGAQVVQRWSQEWNSWQLALVPLGVTNGSDAVASIEDGDIRVDGRPRLSTDGRIVRVYTLRANHPIGDGEPDEATFIDADAIAEHGGDAGEPLELDLVGVRVEGGAGDILQAFIPSLSGIRGRLGYTRARWSIAVDSDVEELLTIGEGDVVRLTADDALDIDGTIGTVGRACQVLAVTRDLNRRRLDLDLVPRPGEAAGYVPAMQVQSVTDADTVTVKANKYTSDRHPVTQAPQTDAEYFAAGTPVVCVPAGDWAGRTATTILTRVGNTITTAAAHGLSAGDTIRFDAYDAVGHTDETRGYAFVADGNETLDGDPARIIG
jgi:hypothetical protein